jgi:hypothetical protein
LETGLLISPEDDETPVVDQYQIGNVNLIWRKLENIDNLPNVQTRTTNHTSAAINQLPKFKPGVIHYSAGSRVKKERPDLRKVSDYFFLMFDQNIIDTWVDQTNVYVRESNVRGWWELKAKEFKIFLSIVFYLGVVKYPARDEVLKSNSKFSSAFCQFMISKSRFDSILHCLHWESTDSYSSEEYKAKKNTDCFFSIRGFLDKLAVNFMRCYDSHQQLSGVSLSLMIKAVMLSGASIP